MFVESQESRVKSRLGECQFARCSSPLNDPSPDICNRTPSRPVAPSGLTLTEVLIAMGILTLGLLGVASMFPVGSYYMQRAEVADRGSAIAQSVMNEIMARGMLNPQSWYVIMPARSNRGPQPTYAVSDGIHGNRAGQLNARPLARTLAEASGNRQGQTNRTLSPSSLATHM